MRFGHESIRIGWVVMQCVFIIPALSQTPMANESPYTLSTHERIHVGLRGGLGLCVPSVIPDSAAQSQPSLGWSAGLMGTLKVGSGYHLEVGGDYQRTTSKQSGAGTENILALNLITTNIALRRDRIFPRAAGPWSSLYLKAGPTFSYWMSGKGTLSVQGQSYSYPIHFVGKADSTLGGLQVPGANRWLAGLDVGVGMSIPIARQQKFFLEVRGTFMLTPLSDDSPAYLNIPGQSLVGTPVVVQQRIHSAWVTLSYTFVHNTMRSNLGRSTKEKQVKKRDPGKQKKTRSYLNTRIKSNTKK